MVNKINSSGRVDPPFPSLGKWFERRVVLSGRDLSLSAISLCRPVITGVVV